MVWARFRPQLVLVLVALAGWQAGCTGISQDSTLQELLDASGLGGVTIADVMNAIDSFTGQQVTLPFGDVLTTDQETQIADLQAQLDAGTLTNQQYVEELASVLGAQDAGQPFMAGPDCAFGGQGFRGGPQRMGGPSPRHDDPLNLTEEQRSAAQDIFDALRTDSLALQEDAQTQIDAVLTADQLAQLETLDHGLPLPRGMRHFGAGVDLKVLTEQLSLTEEQQTQIQTILDDTQAALEARRAQAQEEFRAILTTEQQTLFDEMEAARQTDPSVPQ